MSTSQTARHDSPVFSFRQQHPDCYYIGVTHAFPAHQNIASQAEELTSGPPTALPAFNHDQQYFTPSFLLTTDRDYYRVNLQFERQKFQLKMHQAEAELSNHEMQVVNPSPNFCQICRSSFDSYVEHIADRTHSRTLAQKQGNKWILETCNAVARREKQIRKMEKETKEEDRGSRKEKKAGKRQPRGMTRVKKKTTSAKGCYSQ